LGIRFKRIIFRFLGYQKEIEKKVKLDEQLEIARNIQQALIPQQMIDDKWLSINGFYRAASEVGGDYYDYLHIDNDKYGLIMSDVAGKGVPASLMMIMIRSMFKLLIKSGVTETQKVVSLINSTLSQDIASDRFATLLFGVFEVRTKIFRYTNAGYGPLMVYRKKNKRCFLLESKTGSLPLGVISDTVYIEEDPVSLNKEDMLVLFTDGIKEARNEKGEEYGIERLSLLIPQLADLESRVITKKIEDEITNFIGGAEQHDDMTLLIMKVK